MGDPDANGEKPIEMSGCNCCEACKRGAVPRNVRLRYEPWALLGMLEDDWTATAIHNGSLGQEALLANRLGDLIESLDKVHQKVRERS